MAERSMRPSYERLVFTTPCEFKSRSPRSSSDAGIAQRSRAANLGLAGAPRTTGVQIPLPALGPDEGVAQRNNGGLLIRGSQDQRGFDSHPPHSLPSVPPCGTCGREFVPAFVREGVRCRACCEDQHIPYSFSGKRPLSSFEAAERRADRVAENRYEGWL